MTRIAINGFGRIGRCIARLAAQDADIDLVAVNDLMDPQTALHLFKYDSVHRRFEDASFDGETLTAGRQKMKYLQEREPGKLPWKEMEIDVVMESTGLFRKRKAAAPHLDAGANKVLLSAPAKGDDPADLTVVKGVNLNDYDPAKHHVVSNASCTTNCLAPPVKVLHDSFTIKHAQMTTIHSYTNDQRILDFPHSDLRRARAGAVSMIPTTTGAAKAIGLVIPDLAGLIDGMAIRVPTPNVSLVDLTALVDKQPDENAVNAAFKAAAEGPMKGIMAYEETPLVSMDFMGDLHSSTVDAATTKVIGNLVKVLAWYDNEMGYSQRMIDVAKYMASKQ
jgi:glyceraldehyde 3-phosphate dehydrogenase